MGATNGRPKRTLWGREFSVQAEGLAEDEIVPFVNQLVMAATNLLKRVESLEAKLQHARVLEELAESKLVRAEEMATQIVQEAKSRAAKIAEEVEVQAKQFIQEVPSPATALARTTQEPLPPLTESEPLGAVPPGGSLVRESKPSTSKSYEGEVKLFLANRDDEQAKRSFEELLKAQALNYERNTPTGNVFTVRLAEPTLLVELLTEFRRDLTFRELGERALLVRIGPEEPPAAPPPPIFEGKVRLQISPLERFEDLFTFMQGLSVIPEVGLVTDIESHEQTSSAQLWVQLNRPCPLVERLNGLPGVQASALEANAIAISLAR